MKNLATQFGCFICLIVATVQVNAAQTVRYQHTDMLGTPVMETDGAGNVISRSEYEPFGKRLGGEKAGIGYTGHLQDEDLGLTYMQARYYDPLIGRFYSNDPVGFTGNPHTFNRYSYVSNNPYKYTDPTGKTGVLAYTPTSSPVGTTGMEKLSLVQQTQGVDFMTGYSDIANAVTSAMSGDLASAATVVAMAVNKPLKLVKQAITKTKAGAPRIKQTFSDGSTADITSQRVKEFTPNTHPKAPEGAMQKVKFENAQPGSKGFKRDPTPDEKKMIEDATE